MRYKIITSNPHDCELLFGTCPILNKEARITARYTEQKIAKADLMPTYTYAGLIECSLLASPKSCPHIERCPNIPKYL